METGFIIRCLQCAGEYKVIPGRRNYRNEHIVFGTDNYGADQISCECGNSMEEYSRFVGGENKFEGEFVVEWRMTGRSSDHKLV